MKQIWACGGGTQSVAIGVLISQGKLPKPDIAVMADTEFEKQSTWDYFQSTLNPLMLSCGVEIHIVKRTEWASLGRMCGSPEVFARSGDILIPAFSNANVRTSKLSAFCSGAWKVEATQRFLSQKLGITESMAVRWIGFSYDEQRRWMRVRDNELIRLPLVDLRITRNECIQIVTEAGLPKPPRSACWMCPNQGNHEWREMITNRPDEFEKACQFDEAIRATDPHVWLHKSCIPLREVNFNPEPDLFTEYCNSGHCFL